MLERRFNLGDYSWVWPHLCVLGYRALNEGTAQHIPKSVSVLVSEYIYQYSTKLNVGREGPTDMCLPRATSAQHFPASRVRGMLVKW